MSLLNYLKETKTELAHVNWPTREQAVVFTLAVIIFSAVVGAMLGAFDFIYTSILKLFI